MDVVAAMGEWKGRPHRLLVDGRVADGSRRAGAAGTGRDHPAGIWRGRRTRRSVLRAGQLVPWRGGADALHRLAERRAESGAADVSAGDVPGRPCPRVEVLRSRATVAASRLVAGVTSLAGNGHPEGGRRAERHFCRQHARDRDRRSDGQAHAYDSAWYRGGLFHDDMRINVPGLWFMSWYDVSVGPNLATYNHVRKTARPEIANQQYAVIAPTLHCSYKRATENTVVGERSMGDARLDYDALTWGWFDMFLKGENNHLLDTLPKVRYYTMGLNKWQTSDTWPPRGAQTLTYYLASGGKANTLDGDGNLTTNPPATDKPDGFEYDPMNPVPSYGGNVCCTGNAVSGGAFDQRKMEARPDILVYSSEPLKEATEVSGPIEVTLYVSSDRKDTDFTVKLLDVYPDGRAYNLDETIQRVRYRDGYDKQVWMEAGKTYKVTLSPMTTSNYFDAGHRIRIEVSSSNFPRFDRNMNTGGKNYDETQGLVAHNSVHHSRQYPSTVKVTVVKRATAADR